MWYDAAVGLALLPAVVIAFGLAARRYASGPVRLTGSVGTTANCLVILALVLNPYTAGGALGFAGLGASLGSTEGDLSCS